MHSSNEIIISSKMVSKFFTVQIFGIYENEMKWGKCQRDYTSTMRKVP